MKVWRFFQRKFRDYRKNRHSCDVTGRLHRPIAVTSRGDNQPPPVSFWAAPKPRLND